MDSGFPVFQRIRKIMFNCLPFPPVHMTLLNENKAMNMSSKEIHKITTSALVSATLSSCSPSSSRSSFVWFPAFSSSTSSTPFHVYIMGWNINTEEVCANCICGHPCEHDAGVDIENCLPP